MRGAAPRCWTPTRGAFGASTWLGACSCAGPRTRPSGCGPLQRGAADGMPSTALSRASFPRRVEGRFRSKRSAACPARHWPAGAAVHYIYYKSRRLADPTVGWLHSKFSLITNCRGPRAGSRGHIPCMSFRCSNGGEAPRGGTNTLGRRPGVQGFRVWCFLGGGPGIVV